jgi:CubicO group peptidase (beta-lactamase class C family)
MRTALSIAFLFVLLATLLAPVSASPAGSTQIDFTALDAAIAAQMSKHGLPGVSLAVIEGDETVYLKGYGTAGTHPMTPQTQLFIGSQSKSFTALVIAQLAERGELDLYAPVQSYIPWFRIADEDASARITVNHFLHHTSGLSDAGHSILLPPNASSEAAVRSLAQAHLTAPVGTQFQYFNLGYDVLTYLIEQVTGEPYAAVVRRQVLDPLGMSTSTADPTAVTDLSKGYTRLFGFAAPMAQPVRDYEIGAGYIVSTAEDMARYARAMLQGGRLISPELAKIIFTPGLGDYGLGWFISRDNAKIWHGGANETFGTHVNLYPKAGRAFVLLINEGHQIDHFVSGDQLMQTVEAIVLGDAPPPVSQGWSVRWIGWGIGILVLSLIILHTYNFYHLRSWRERARRMTPGKKAWDVAISFLIPTVILIVVFSQIKGFYGNRFSLLPTIAYFRFGLPDVFILMLVGTVPDTIQGLIKLSWLATGRARRVTLEPATP